MAKTKSTKSIAARTQTDGWRGHQVEQCFWHAAVISGAAPDTCPALLSGEVRKTEKEVYTISESDNICWRNYHRYETHEGSYTCDVRGEHANTISCGTTPCQLIHDLQESPSDSTMTKKSNLPYAWISTRGTWMMSRRRFFMWPQLWIQGLRLCPSCPRTNARTFMRVITKAARSQVSSANKHLTALSTVRDFKKYPFTLSWKSINTGELYKEN